MFQWKNVTYNGKMWFTIRLQESKNNWSELNQHYFNKCDIKIHKFLLSLCDPRSCCGCRYFICQDCLDSLIAGNLCPSKSGKFDSMGDGTNLAPYWFAIEYCQQQGSRLASIHSLEKVSKKWKFLVKTSLLTYHKA